MANAHPDHGTKTLDVITIGRASVDLYGQQIGTRLADLKRDLARLPVEGLDVDAGEALRRWDARLLAVAQFCFLQRKPVCSGH